MKSETLDIRNNNFNFIRLLLAILVIFSHSFELINGQVNEEILIKIFHTISFGQLAVDGFFTLSGYLIVQSWYLNPNTYIFLKSRILRIYPGFIIATLICIFIVGPIGSDDTAKYFLSVNWLVILKNILFLHKPDFYPVFSGWPDPELNRSMWTIAYEFKCYLLVLMLGIAGVIHNKRYWLIISLCINFLFLYSQIKNNINFFDYNFQIKNDFIRLASFFFTGGCYYLFKEQIKITRSVYFCLSIIVVIGLFSNLFSENILVLAGSSMLFLLANSTISWLSFFQKLPDVSYGVYLYGWPVQKLLIFYINEISPWEVLIIGTLLSILLGWFSWVVVEKPCIKLKKLIR